MTPTILNSCCFSGHRKISSDKIPSIVEKLNFEISYLAEHGVEDFYAGGALGFDTIAALSIIRYKQFKPAVKLHLMLPCADQCRGWSQHDIDIYNSICARADSVKILADHYHGGVMHMRNRAMVDASEYCICYWEKDNGRPEHGGTLYTINYARKLGRKIINLCDDPPEDVQIEFNFSV